MTQKIKVLIIDDDDSTRELFRQFVQQAGYEALLAADAEHGLEQAVGQAADLILSDIRLPRQSGLDLLKQLREQQADCEIILMTGFPEVDSAIQALRIGACDYLTRPVSQDMLLDSLARARHRLLQSRQRRAAVALLEAGLKHFTEQTPPPAEAPLVSSVPPVRSRRYVIGPLMLDADRFVIEIDGRRVDATPSELEILHYLCRHPDRVVTSQELVQKLRGYSVTAEEAGEIIRPHVSNLRRKLLAASPAADLIVTVRGVGYMLKTPPAG